MSENGDFFGRRCTENGLQWILKLHFYFDPDATNVNSVDFKDPKRVQKGVQKRVPGPTDTIPRVYEGSFLKLDLSMFQNTTYS